MWCVLLAAVSACGESLNGQVVIRSLSFRYADVTGIGKEIGVCRRDPSDVIRVGDTCYVYYTKVIRDELPEARRRLYPSGYPGTVWYAVSRDEGRTWDERGQTLALGEPGAFDSFGVFTPNILAYEDKYWLYYTGMRPTPGKAGVFENNSTNDPTAIGVAVADLPDGPFKRVANNSVLVTGRERQAFDSYRVDDACLVVRDGKVWLYYKGRSTAHGRAGPGRTRMGVAVADHPGGSFVKQNDGRPVHDSGHEVQVFVCDGAVMSLVSPTGPNGCSLQRAEDGLSFRTFVRGLVNQPKAPGLYRPELTGSARDLPLPTWGIAMETYGGDPYLVRYECIWNAP